MSATPSMRLPLAAPAPGTTRSLLVLITSLVMLLCSVANAQSDKKSGTQSGETPPAVGTTERAEMLDDLHARLKAADTRQQIMLLERNIWSIWLHHGNPTIDALMSDAMKARREANYDKAIQITDKIIELDPDYAEGWNQRATLNFLRESYEESLRDVAETLSREPRHFGALAGRGVIRMRQGKPALAIQNILEALKVNPHLRERQLLPALGYREIDA
jgi:tetratricopeptide (TPR) repeat protein